MTVRIRHEEMSRTLKSIATYAAMVLFAGACGTRGGGGSPDGGGPVIDHLEITPGTTSLDVFNNQPTTQGYTATAFYANGQAADVTSTTEFTIDGSFGTFSGALFTTSGNASGTTTVTAIDGNAMATAQLTVHLHTQRVDPSAPADAASLFTNGVVDADVAPLMVYPDDQVVVPSNLGTFEVHWTDDQGNSVFEVTMSSQFADAKVYLGGPAPHFNVFSPAEWNTVTAGAIDITFGVRGASPASPGIIGAAPTRTAHLTNQPIAGGLYYWSVSRTDSTLQGIFRHDLSDPGTQPQAVITQQSNQGICVGCHAISRDGNSMSVTYGPDSPATIMTFADNTSLPATKYWNMATFTADSKKLVTVTNGKFSLRSAADASIIKDIDTNGWAADPDISHGGDKLAYALPASADYDYHIEHASIQTMPYDTATDTFGAPTTLVAQTGSENNYYPSWSPDDEWMLFTKSTDDSYDIPSAELWFVKTDGNSAPVKMDVANIGPGLTNSWSRWAPFPQTLGVNAEPMFWITFSSKRDFGVRIVGQDQPQIWMAPFFPARAAAGLDPTGPAFRVPFQSIVSDNHIAQWTEVVVQIP